MKKLFCMGLVLALLLSFCAFAEDFNWEGSGKVTIYCGHGSDMAEEIFAAFTEKTGVEVEAIYGGGGELMARVQAEANNPLGDVVYGVTTDMAASHQEYFQPFTVESVTPEQIGQETLEEAYWTTGTGGSIMAFMINTDMLAEEDYPTSWKDLADEKYRGQIAFVDPTASSSAYAQLCIMQQLYGWEFVEAFYKNLDGKMATSSSGAPKACADGEYAIALTIEFYGADYISNGAHIAMVYPEDGTINIPSATTIIKDCKNPENAKLFAEFTYSETVAEIFAKYLRRGERSDAPLPDGLAEYSTIAFFDGYDADLAADKTTMLENWNEIVINN